MTKLLARGVMLLIVLMASSQAFAKTDEKSALQLQKANTPALFIAQADQVRKDIDGGKRYGALSAGDRMNVLEGLARMQALLEKSGDTASMNDRDRIALFNDQEAVNGILLRNDQDRLVCDMERRTGSKMPTRVCRTVRDITLDRSKGREAIEDLRSRPVMERGN